MASCADGIAFYIGAGELLARWRQISHAGCNVVLVMDSELHLGWVYGEQHLMCKWPQMRTPQK